MKKRKPKKDFWRPRKLFSLSGRYWRARLDIMPTTWLIGVGVDSGASKVEVFILLLPCLELTVSWVKPPIRWVDKLMRTGTITQKMKYICLPRALQRWRDN